MGRRAIERAVGVKQRGEKPGQRKQAIVNAFQRFDLLMTKRAAFDDDGEAERKKKYHADKNHDAVEFQSRVAAAGDDEGDRADEK